MALSLIAWGLWALGLFPGELDPRLLLLLTLAFSLPHFAASYWVFYGPGGSWRRQKVVAFALPAALIVAIIAGSLSADLPVMLALGHLTLGLLFWHYLKQAYGVALVGESRAGRVVGPKLKQGLLFACLALGSLGFLDVHQMEGQAQAFGLYLPMATVPSEIVTAGRVFAALSVIGVLGVGLARRGIGWRSALPLLALWAWVEPASDGSWYKAVLPVFHGLQYLPFPARVFRYRYGKLAKQAAIWLGLAAAGWALMRWAPQALQKGLAPELGARVAAGFTIFFNVHHYCIDAVAWRLKDSDVRQSLGL